MGQQKMNNVVAKSLAYLFTIALGIIFVLLPPLSVWILVGDTLLNSLLGRGLPYSVYLILGYGGGQTIFIIIWLFIMAGLLAKNNIGCLVLIAIIAIGLVIIWAINPTAIKDGTLVDYLFPPRLSIDPRIIATISPACKGIPVPEAADYPGDLNLHPMILVSESGGWHEQTNTLPKAWRPRSVGDIQLVACASEIQSKTIEVCDYIGGVRYRKLKVMNVRIVAVKTGEVVAKILIEGTSPPNCPGIVSSHTRDFEGGMPNIYSIIDALALFVER